MGEEASHEGKNGTNHPPSSPARSWITALTRNASRQQLERAASVLVLGAACYDIMRRNRPGEKKSEQSKQSEKNGGGSPPGRIFQRSLSMAALHGGRTTMQRILDAHGVGVDASAIESIEMRLKELLSAKGLLNFVELQSVVAKLEMTGKEFEAAMMLTEARDEAIKQGQFHEAYELEMFIVEMLIYQGDYHKALECNCLQHVEISDARRLLYKTVIQIMLGNKRVAEEYWKEFQIIRDEFESPQTEESSSLHGMGRDFDLFCSIVLFHKKEIEGICKTAKLNYNVIQLYIYYCDMFRCITCKAIPHLQ